MIGNKIRLKWQQNRNGAENSATALDDGMEKSYWVDHEVKERRK